MREYVLIHEDSAKAELRVTVSIYVKNGMSKFAIMQHAKMNYKYKPNKAENWYEVK